MILWFILSKNSPAFVSGLVFITIKYRHELILVNLYYVCRVAPLQNVFLLDKTIAQNILIRRDIEIEQELEPNET
jgi:hypothetical protein